MPHVETCCLQWLMMALLSWWLRSRAAQPEALCLPLWTPLQVLVIPTDEQLEIAEQTLAVVERHQRGGGQQQARPPA